MAEVNISINGRAYEICCDTGQEGRIVDLAGYIDQRVQSIARAGGAYNDAHILVLAALVLADELFEAREGTRGAARQQPAVQQAQAAAPGVSKEDEQLLVRALDQLAKRIDGIASKVQQAA